MSAVLQRSPSAVLLDRLDGVITTGSGWRARCPAHGGKSASLSIAEVDDGRVLMHCFAGCAALDVLAAVGLQMGDLFPARSRDMSLQGRRARRDTWRQAGWAAALGVIGREAKVIQIAGHDIAGGRHLSDADIERLALAIVRIDDAREVLT